jgi:hypothetical protein
MGCRKVPSIQHRRLTSTALSPCKACRRASTGRMAEKVKTTQSLKSASGSGFDFEDEVAAVFLAEMLAGQPSMLTEWGAPHLLQRQVACFEPHGDIVLSFHDQQQRLFRCGVSVKSAPPHTAKAFKPDLVEDAWRGIHSEGFETQDDFVALAIPPLGKRFVTKANELTSRARATAKGELEESLRGKSEKEQFDSFRNPSDLAETPTRLLRKLVIRDTFDFMNPVSIARNGAVRLCAAILTGADDDASAGRDLWNDLVKIATKLRMNGGDANVASILADLGGRYDLCDIRHDLGKWKLLRRISDDCMQAISSELPGGIRIPRTSLIQQLSRATRQGVVSVIGPSGSGKSALVKAWAESFDVGSREIVWITKGSLARCEMSASELSALLLRTRRKTAILVIDGIEHWHTEQEFAYTVSLIAVLKEDARWRVAITCQEHDWERVHKKLNRGGNLTLSPVACGKFEEGELQELCSRSQRIASIARSDLGRIMRVPHMLRVILESSLYGDGGAAERISVSSVVQGWWEDKVNCGQSVSSSGTLAKRIGGRLADELDVEVPEDIAGGAEEAARSLINNGVLRRTTFGALQFVHDLYAEWARMQSLRPLQPEKLLEFVRTRVEQPPWFRSLIGLCRQFLEMDREPDRWRIFLRGLSEAHQRRNNQYGQLTIEPVDLRLADAALQGLLYCSRLPSVLMELRGDLVADNFLVLGRLLMLMKQAVSTPDPVLRRSLNTEAGSSEAEEMLLERIAPLRHIDILDPVIHFLYQERFDAAPVLSGQIASIVPVFGRLTRCLKELDFKVPRFCVELAELAVMIGEQELKWEIKDPFRMNRSRMFFVDEVEREEIYAAALMAVDVFPERVVKLALKAAGRVNWEDGDLPPEFDSSWLGQFEPSGYDDFQVIQPTCGWEAGPRRKKSYDFSKAWLDNGAWRVASLKPEIIEEVTMAFLIGWPRRKPPAGGGAVEKHGFDSQVDKWYPPFWHHGPFLVLLRHSFQHGLSLVVNLVNFATERIAEWWPYPNDPTVTVELNTPVGRVEWMGHSQVFNWNVYSMNTNEGVTCGLMALEKVLLDTLVAGKPVTEVIEYLYKHGRSLAFAGLLISIGKARPELFVSELRPLLAIRKFFLWDETLNRSMLNRGWFGDPDIVNQWRQEWRDLPHRSVKLIEICGQLMRASESARAMFLEVANLWRAEAQSLPEEHPERIPILRWASDFDFKTWAEVKLPDGSHAWVPQRPLELQNEEERQRLNHKQILITLPYQCCEALNAQEVLSAESCSHLWAIFLELANRESTGDDGEFESQLMSPQHSLAGIGAWLLCLGEGWLELNPEILSRLEGKLLYLFRNLEPTPCFTRQDTMVDSEEFLARAAVRLWAMQCNPQQWRGACAYLACAERYGVIQALMDEAFHLRDRLGTGFEDLCIFVTAQGVERQESGPLGVRQPNSEHLDEWRAKWSGEFVIGNLPPLAEGWWTLPARRCAEASVGNKEDETEPMAALEPLWRGHDGRASRISYGFDPYYMLAAFSFVPFTTGGIASAPQGLASWKHMDDILFAAMLHTIRSAPPYRGRAEAYTYDSDHKIIGRIAQRTLIDGAPNPEQYWRALMDKGQNASSMITRYISNLRTSALRAPEERVSRLIPIWHGVIRHLQTFPEWNEGDCEGRNEVFDELLFVGTTNQMSGWDGEDVFAPLILSMAEHYEAAVKGAGRQTHKLENLLGLLSSDGVRVWLPRVFNWCHDAVMSYSSIYWNSRGLRSAFSRLLEAGWRHRFDKIRADERAFACFKRVAFNLAAAQEPIALEVQNSLGSSQAEC